MFLLGTFYAAMVVAGLVIELVFSVLGLIPDERNARVIEASIELNYTTVLNIIFLVLATVLVWRFLKTGGLPMLKMMGEPADHATTTNTMATERMICAFPGSCWPLSG